MLVKSDVIQWIQGESYGKSNKLSCIKSKNQALIKKCNCVGSNKKVCAKFSANC